MFEKQEAFDFIRNFLKVEDAESRMKTNRRELLDDIIFNLQKKIPFQNISLLSVPPEERRKPTRDEMKANFKSGIGGLCFDMNIPTFHLLSAIGFDVTMTHCTVSTTVVFSNNHVTLTVRHVQREGDEFLIDTACGHPTFRPVSLDFERESPVFFDSYLEYKFVKEDGKLIRFHRKGDVLVARGEQEYSAADYWVDGWRRFYTVDLDTRTKDWSKFDAYHKEVYINPTITPFHLSHRVVIFPEGKAAMVINNKTYTEIDGQLVVSELDGGDEAIKAKIKEIYPNLPRELLPLSLRHWRQSAAASI